MKLSELLLKIIQHNPSSIKMFTSENTCMFEFVSRGFWQNEALSSALEPVNSETTSEIYAKYETEDELDEAVELLNEWKQSKKRQWQDKINALVARNKRRRRK